MAEALYRRYRPRTFAEVVGQDHVTTTLKNQISSGRIGHAYLFVGSRGCGKTTCARLLAKELNMAVIDPNIPAAAISSISDAINEGRHMDIIEFDAASHTGVDNIREILDKVPFRPSQLAYKVYIIDEVHMLSQSAYNALLKTLEEPPSHVVFILATTDPQKIPATVISRCQRFNFKRVPINTMVARLRTICDAEGIETDDLALTLIARQATGALRDAVSLLDQLASSSSLRITADDVREALGATDTATVKALVEAIIERDASAGMEAIQRALDQGADARQIARQLVDTLRTLTQLRVAKDGRGMGELSEGERVSLGELASRANGQVFLHGIRAFSAAINEMRSSTDAQLALEMALLGCVVERNPAASTGEPSDGPARSVPESGRAAPTRQAAVQTSRSHAANAASAHAESSAESHTTLSTSHVTQPNQTDGFDALQKNWKAIGQELSRTNKPVLGWLNSARLHSVEGSVVYIKANHDMAFQQLNDPRKIQSIATAIQAVTGVEYSIQVFIGERAVREASEDPVLRAARQLGGKLRD